MYVSSLFWTGLLAVLASGAGEERRGNKQRVEERGTRARSIELRAQDDLNLVCVCRCEILGVCPKADLNLCSVLGAGNGAGDHDLLVRSVSAAAAGTLPVGYIARLV